MGQVIEVNTMAFTWLRAFLATSMPLHTALSACMELGGERG